MLDRAELEQMLNTMARSGAATLHLMAGRMPFLRLKGKLVRSHGGAASSEELRQLADEILSPDQRGRLANGATVGGFFVSESGHRFRHTISRERDGLSLVFRRMPKGMPSFDELGLPEVISSFAYFERGLVLVTGFLGTGKTTTLGALVDRLNQSSSRHIVTIEQPIEFVHEPVRSVIHHREVGREIASHALGIREATRQSADVIVVGNIRDYETLDAAIDAAERGCLVLGALEASNVVGALEELVTQCPDAQTGRMLQRLSTTFCAMISQSLVQRGHSQGRVPLLEILINSRAVTKAIVARDFQSLPGIMDRNHGLGMQTVDRGLKNLVNRNVITMDEALDHACDRDQVCQRGRA